MISFLDVGFWQQLVVTVVGVVFGIPLALWLNRRQEEREQKTQVTELAQRREQLVNALIATLTDATTVLKPLRDLDAGRIAYVSLDLTLLDSTASLKYELLDDIELCKAIDGVRYGSMQLNRKLDLHLRIYSDGALRAIHRAGSGAGNTLYKEMHAPLLTDIKKDAGALITACNETLRKLEEVRAL